MIRNFAALSLLMIILVFAFPDVSVAQTEPRFTPVQLKAECQNVKILDPDNPADHERVPEDQRYVGGDPNKSNLVKPGRYQKKAVYLALNTLSGFVCRSVRWIAIYKNFPDRLRLKGGLAVVEQTAPSLIQIDGGLLSEGALDPYFTGRFDKPGQYGVEWIDAIFSISHEAFHCATFLLNSLESGWQNPFGIDAEDYWSAGSIADARKIVRKVRLEDGFTDIWEDLQSRAVRDLKIQDYQPSRLEISRDKAPAPGFMTFYAQRMVLEDIADTAAAVVTRSVIFNAEYIDPADDMQPPDDVESWVQPCQLVKNDIKAGVNEKHSILFAKLNFLKDVGFYDEKTLSACVGQSSAGINKNDRQKTGFHFYNYKTGEYQKSYTDDFSITRTSSGALRIKAKDSIRVDGKELDSFVEIQFKTNKNDLPRGYYSMTWNGTMTNPGPKFAQCNHLFPLRIPADSFFAYSQQVPGSKSQSFCSLEARVLVSNATEDHLEISLILFKVVRTTPIRKTPHVFEPPLQVIIRWKRNWNDDPPLVS